MTYEEKIETILDNKLEYNGNHKKDIQDVKTWLCCEWQCNQLDMDEYRKLCDMVDETAEKIIKNL
jgi:hypothetical protein